MSSSLEFLQYLQSKKMQLNNQSKHIKLDLQDLYHRIQAPPVKIQKERIKITEEQFICLIKQAKGKFMKQQSLLKLQAPIYVATGTYGSYQELSLIFQKCGNPKLVNYIFLGDYTGNYNRGIQCLVALLTYKVKFPLNFFMLRGQFESTQISRSSMLYKQVINYLGSAKIWNEICQLFCCLPFAATISDKIFCVHGGISPYLFSLQQINQIYRPIDTPSKGLPYQLIFSHPSYEEVSEWRSQKFGEIQTENFLKRTNLKIICRGHCVAKQGFEYLFNKSLVNLCSISNFGGQYRNSSAVMMVDQQQNVIFKQINSSISVNQQNEQGLTLQEIIQRRQQKNQRLDKLERQEKQKILHTKQLEQKQNIEKKQKEQKRKQKEQKRKLRRLRKQMLEEKLDKQQLQKQGKTQDFAKNNLQ